MFNRLFDGHCKCRAVQQNPQDPDLHTVLGVLFNLSRDFDAAIASFTEATKLEPTSYSLWNKLGATQANSPSPEGSKQAGSCYDITECSITLLVYAYRRALELKPNYVRAWVNMGISYVNQGKYPTAAKYYLRALR